MFGHRDITGLLTPLITWRLKRKDPYKGIPPSELRSPAAFPGVWKGKGEKIPDGHKLVSIPSRYHKRPVDGACAAEAAMLMQLMVPRKDTAIIGQHSDPFIYCSCQNPKPLVQVGSLLPVEA